MKPHQKAYAIAALSMLATVVGRVAVAPDGTHFPLLSFAMFTICVISAGFGLFGQFGPLYVRKYVRDNF